MKFVSNLLSHFAKVYLLNSHFSTINTREVQHIINKLCHMLCCRTNAMQIGFPLFINLVLKFIKENLAKPIDTPQWGTEVVRNGIGKCFEFFVGSLQLSGTLYHQTLKLLAAFPNVFQPQAEPGKYNRTNQYNCNSPKPPGLPDWRGYNNFN